MEAANPVNRSPQCSMSSEVSPPSETLCKQSSESTLTSVSNNEQSSCIAQFFTLLWSWITCLFCCSATRVLPELKVEGALSFNAEEISLLKELFLVKDFKERPYVLNTLTVQGKTINIQPGQGSIFEIDAIPNRSFVFNPSDEQYELIQTIQRVANEDYLDELIIPGWSLLSFLYEEEEYHMIVREKYPVPTSTGEIQAVYERFPPTLRAVSQLTTLICKANIADISWLTLPLVKSSDGYKVVVNNPTFSSKYGLKEGLLGWVSPKETVLLPPGLLHIMHTPATISREVQKALPEAEFAEMKAELHEECKKVEAILERKREIITFHRNAKIEVTSPAIPTAFIGTLDPSDRTLYYEIAEAINKEIAQQNETHANLIYAREWHLQNSMWHIISDNRKKIEEEFLPLLKDRGIAHSILNKEEAIQLDFGLRKYYIGPNDLFVQF